MTALTIKHYNKTEQVLCEDENILKGKPIFSPHVDVGGTYTKEAIFITESLWKAGIDVTKLQKQELSKYIIAIVRDKNLPKAVRNLDGSPLEVNTAPAATTNAKLLKKGANRAKAAPKTSVPSAVVPKPTPGYPVQIESGDPSPTTDDKPEQPLVSTSATVMQEVAHTVQETAPVENSAPIAEKTEFVRPGIPYIVGLAVISNVQGARVLLEPYVKNDKTLQTVSTALDEIINALQAKTVLPQ
jgi:hypothetical protein